MILLKESSKKTFFKKSFPLLLITLFILLATFFPITQGPISLLEYPVRKNSIPPEWVVATVLSPNSYWITPDGTRRGLDYDLVTDWAQKNHQPIRLIVFEQLNDAILAILTHRADWLAGPVPQLEDLQKVLHFLPPYNTETPEIVYNNTLDEAPHSLSDLTQQKVAVPNEILSYAKWEHLKKLWPTIHWDFLSQEVGTLELMSKINRGELHFGLSDSQSIQYAQQIWPDLEAAFKIGQPVSLGWVTSDQLPSSIKESLNRYFNLEWPKVMNHFKQRYSETAQPISWQSFIQAVHETLPKYLADFKAAQIQSNFDWRLLAAVAYQESHWDNNAISSTGVRGIMMLTSNTADRLGVHNRLNSQESIQAAAFYLASLYGNLPASIHDPDRLWMTLAAYDIGQAHLEDARILCQRNHLNPNLWIHVRQMLPELALPEVYSTIRYGYARGSEPVGYVDRVHEYYDQLKRLTPAFHPLEERVFIPAM